MPYTDLYRGRFSHSNYCYDITTVTRNRRPIFADLFAGRVVVTELRDLQKEALAHTLCYVVMPDHVHWLMQLGNTSLGKVMQYLKGRTSRRLGGQVWQQRYYDHALRKEEDLRVMARYIVANPLRSGLVERVGDYPLWDAVWLGDGGDWSG